MANIPDLSKLGKKRAPEGTADNRIHFDFADDHDVNDARVDVHNVTPEQVFVAVGHLQRIALMLLAQRDALAQQAEMEARAVQSQLAREKGN